MTEDTTKHPQDVPGDGGSSGAGTSDRGASDAGGSDAGGSDCGGSDRGASDRGAPGRRATEREPKPRKPKDPGAPGLASVLRTRAAQVVWTAAVVCALFLAVGALLVALKANTGNALVRFVLDVADALDLQVFSRRNGVFKMTGADAATKNALANWGLAAVAYLVVGRVVDRVVRP